MARTQVDRHAVWVTAARPGGQRGEGGGDRRRRGEGDRQARERSEESEFAEKLVSINRVAKVLAAVGAWLCRAGRCRRPQWPGRLRLGQGARGAGGNPQGEQQRRGLVRVPLREGRTLHHDIADRYGRRAR